MLAHKQIAEKLAAALSSLPQIVKAPVVGYEYQQIKTIMSVVGMLIAAKS